MISLLVCLGAGCKSSDSVAPDVSVVPSFPSSCGPDSHTPGLRDPATQQCVPDAPAERQAAYLAFDLLHSYATTAPSASTLAVVRFSAGMSTRRALELLATVPSATETTLSLQLPDFRGGTTFPLELSQAERASLDAVQAALDEAVAFRGYSAAELVELHRAVGEGAVVTGVVVQASFREVHALWSSNASLVRTVQFDLPLTN
ncbi:MAG: hypothetical protein EPO40_01745 [Myxococcaceae bacterium]|nr:MAG: hypothetical protein EPO40_01745 [Myxococcaceae bacterium]